MATRKRNGEGPISLKALAEYLKLHPATVSVVLNDIPGRAVPEPTRARIKEAARLFGYRPNALAASLRTGRTRSVGVVLPELSNGLYASIMNGLGNRLTQRGYCYMALHHGYSPITARHNIEILSTRGVEGLILIDAMLDRCSTVPAITIGCRGLLEGTARIEFDQYRAAALTLGYLANRDRRKLLVLNRNLDGTGEDSLSAAVRETAESVHIEIVDGVIPSHRQDMDHRDFCNRVRYAVTESIAILTFNIQDANAAAVAACDKSGGSGSQCPVLCIDRYGTGTPLPGVSVIRQPPSAVGQLSADAILQWICSGEDFGGRVLTVEPELVGARSGVF